MSAGVYLGWNPTPYWDLFANSVKEGEACEAIIEFLKQHRALSINGKIRRLMALKDLNLC